MRRSSLHHLHDAPAGHVRQHVAARIHRRESRRCPAAHAQRLDHARPWCEAVPMVMQWPWRAVHAGFGLVNSSMRHLAGPHLLGHGPDVGAGADVLAAVLAVEHRPAGDADGRAGRRWPRPSAAPAWSCRSPPAAPRHRSGCRGSIPPHPCWPGCGTAWRSAAAGFRPGTSPETPAGSRRPPARRASPARPVARKWALQGVSSDQVLQMPITGRPSNWSCGTPWFFIQLR